MEVSDEALGASPGRTAFSADLGGSSKYFNKNFEGPKWGKVPYEQQLDMG